VPCSATAPKSAAATPPSASAAPTAAVWLGPCGAVSDDDRPSWLTHEPRARMESGAGAAGASSPPGGSATMRKMTHPSPRPYPSAPASSVLQRPSGANIPAPTNVDVARGPAGALTPAARPAAAARTRRACSTRWAATKEDEHAVSTARQGP
jgi:hypothetical protein